MNIDILSEKLRNNEYLSRMQEIYVDEDTAEAQKNRYLQALAHFREAFGDAEVEIYSAPGRTEVGGNHTDHQHGEVLAASINKDAIAIVTPTTGNIVELISDGYPLIRIDCDDLSLHEDDKGNTAALLRGVLAGIREHSYKVGAFQAYVTSDVLIGAGLSSSAAFETLIGTIVSGLYNENRISAVEIAIIGQYAENVHFGKPCGLMDQMACSVGSLVHIDFSDPSSPVTEKIEFDFSAEELALCITDTKGSHADLTEDYAAVPAEMKKVASCFGKSVLREVAEKDVLCAIPMLREKCGDRAVLRALHYYEENKRVEKEVAALKEKDIDSFLATVKASGASSFQYLQNVYTNHDTAHQNVSIALLLGELVLKGSGAVRVHGGGFAGTMQAWVPKSLVPQYKTQMDAVFGKGSCDVLQIRRFGGIKVI